MRPIQKGLFYFPFDCNFFQNKKIKMLRRSFGSVGVLTYINLLCRIYSNGYYFKFDSIESLSMDITEDIAFVNQKRVAAQVTETISYLINQDVLDKHLFEQNVISGKAVQRQYAESVKGLKRKAQIGIYSLLEKEEGGGVGGSTPKNGVSSEETPINSAETAINSEIMQQREREREREINIPPSLCAYGSHRNVMLTREQYDELTKRVAAGYVDRFSEKLKEHGYTYSDHYKAILEWWEIDKHKYAAKKTEKGNNVKVLNSTYDVKDFFNAALERSTK